MTNFFSLDFLFLLPQVFIAIATLTGLVLFSAYGSFVRSSGRLPSSQASAFLGLTFFFFLLLLFPIFSLSSVGLFSTLLFSPFLNVYSLLVVLATIAVLFLYSGYSSLFDLTQFEVPFLLAFTSLATLVIISSNDLLVAYLGLEFQGLLLYVLAASRVNSTYSTEAGLKYFVLGSFASCVLLLGISFLYGAVGVLNFSDLGLFFLSSALTLPFVYQKACLLALLLIVLGLLFKVGSAPFHFWVVDVYTGSSIAITTFFAVVPKVAAWLLLLKISFSILYVFVGFFANLFVLVGLCSLVVGTFGAVSQTSLKRILAFSAVAHTGYLLLGLASFQTITFVSNVLYLVVYTVALVPIFALLIFYSPRNASSTPVDSIYGLRFIYKHNRVAGLVLVLSLFSVAGVPPLSGFFAKLYVFFSLLSANYAFVAVFALLLSAASAIYYLKLIRFTHFFGDSRSFLFLNELPRPVAYVISILFMLNISFFVWGSDFLLVLCQIQSNFLL
jgi:NADH-quinone oxidoreductase subunit N